MKRIVTLIFFIMISMCCSDIYAEEDFAITTEDGFEIDLSSDGNISALKIDNHSLTVVSGPVLWIRDMSNAGTITSPNLIENYSFESSFSGWQILKQSNSQIEVNDNKTHTGTYSLQFYGTSSSDYATPAVVSDTISVTPGKFYRISGYFLSSNGYVQNPDGTSPVRQDEIWRSNPSVTGIYVKWYDKNNDALDEATVLVAPLHWNAKNWRKVSGEVFAPHDAYGMKVVIGGKLLNEYLWIDDVVVVESPENESSVVTTVTEKDGNIVQTGVTDSGIRIETVYTSHSDYIGIDITITDNQQQDNKSFELVWRLPVNLGSDWYWLDDIHNKRVINHEDVAEEKTDYNFHESLSHIYENIVSGIWDGWLPVSIYPFAGVENGSYGIAMAVSLEQPYFVKLAYDQTKPAFEARAYLAISPLATKLNNSAKVSFEIYKFNPEWGFRDVADKFAKRHSDWFSTKRAGICYTDFNRGYLNSAGGAQKIKEDDSNNILSAQYIVAEPEIDLGSTRSEIPDYDAAVEVVNLLNNETEDAFKNSVAYSANGDWQIKHIGEFEWNRGQWGAVWFTSIDPDIENGWAEFLYDNLILPAISFSESAGAVIDGVMMDNYLNSAGIDLREDHIKLADYNLAYDISTYLPGVPAADNMFEFFTWIRNNFKEINRDDIAITVNFWAFGGSANGTVPLIDVFGSEGETDTENNTGWNTRLLDYRRTIAFHKKISFSNGASNLSLQQIKDFLNLALFYGIFPHKKEEAINWESGYETYWNNTLDLLFKFYTKKWQPLTYASSDNSNVWIERYGTHLYSCDDVYFTFHNISENNVTANISFYLDKLGFSTSNIAIENLSDNKISTFTIQDNRAIIQLQLERKETVVFKISQEKLSFNETAPIVTISPKSDNFSNSDIIDFSFSLSDINGLSDINDFKFFFCNEDITEDILEFFVSYIVESADSAVTVSIPGLIFPPGQWEIEIVAGDSEGNSACDKVVYSFPVN